MCSRLTGRTIVCMRSKLLSVGQKRAVKEPITSFISKDKDTGEDVYEEHVKRIMDTWQCPLSEVVRRVAAGATYTNAITKGR